MASTKNVRLRSTRRRSVHRWVLLAGGLAALSASAVAAQPAPPDPRYAAAPPSDSIDADRLALAHAFVRESHIDRGMRGMFANVMRSMPQVTEGESDAKARQMTESFSAGLEATLPQLMDASAEVAARAFTTQELKDLVAFYASPSGQAMVTKTPMLMQQIGPLAYQILPKVYAAAESDFCSRVSCTDGDRARFEHLQASFARQRPPGAVN